MIARKLIGDTEEEDFGGAGLKRFSPKKKRNEIRPKQDREPPRILIVDDSLKAVTPLNIIFQNLGCRTEMAFDGLTAVEQIVACQPDLIVLDWKMPGCNGSETLMKAQLEFSIQELRSSMPVLTIPVVTFSAKSIIEFDPPECEAFRVVDHWQKPLVYSQLIQKAEFLLDDVLR